MTHLNMPSWCRALIEKSNEAYVLIEKGEITFLNRKALSLLEKSVPGFHRFVGCRVQLQGNRLIFNANVLAKEVNLIVNQTDICSNLVQQHPGDLHLNFEEIDLIYEDQNLQLVRLKETVVNQDSISASEQCYYSLFNTVKDAIFIQDEDGHILEANEGAEKMYGYPRSFFKGKTTDIFSAYHEGEFESIKQDIKKAFNGEPQKFEVWGKRSNGEVFPKEVLVYKGIFFGKPVLIALTSDITERMQVQAQIEAYTIQLQELVETRDKVYSIVAHDLRSSFNSILGLSELLSEDWDQLDEKKKQTFAKNIYIASDGSFKLLQNLLDWSKHQSGILEYDPIYFDLCGVVNEILSLYRLQSLRKNISLQSTISSPSMVYADVNMVQSILRNLISNALKFTPVNGKVWVTGSLTNGENGEPLFSIAVHDTGVGISVDRMSDLLDSRINSTTLGTANEQGTGLGILICKEMTEKNRGRLWIESEQGKGSVFSFTLPLRCE